MPVRLLHPRPCYNFIILKKLLFFKRIQVGSPIINRGVTLDKRRGQNSHRGVKLVTTVAVRNHRSPCCPGTAPKANKEFQQHPMCRNPLFSAVFPIFCSSPLYQLSGLHFYVNGIFDTIRFFLTLFDCSLIPFDFG